ncbi:MAG: DHH family phosphoesterase [Lachnospiraceae bacterium]
MNLIKECRNADVIGIAGHVRPDGDCTGSCMALYFYLKDMLPKARIYVYLEESAKSFTDIDGLEFIDSTFHREEQYDVFFALDTTPNRLGEAEELYESAIKKINIDHHISNKGVGDICFVDPSIGSTAEIIYDMIPEDCLTLEIAKAIYIGIIHDTGVFQYSNTKPSTLIAASKLIQKGFPFWNMIEESFYQKSYNQMKATARVMLESELFLDGKCIVGKLSKEQMKAQGVTNNDLGGVINQLRQVAGVKCALFAYELEPSLYKISLRTSDEIDAVAVVTVFGGGGHKKAAGVTIEGDYEQIIADVLEEIRKQIELL